MLTALRLLEDELSILWIVSMYVFNKKVVSISHKISIMFENI